MGEEINRKLVTDATNRPQGYQQITNLATAVGIRARNGRWALLQATGQNVRWRDDGVDPTTTVGMVLYTGQLFPYYGDVKAIRLIEVAASAKLNVSVYY